MKRTLLAALASVLIISALRSQTIKSPDEFLGYELGTQFTYHHKAVEYFKYIAEIHLLQNTGNMEPHMKDVHLEYVLFQVKRTLQILKNTEKITL